MENNTDNKKILKGGQKVVKTVWKMPQTQHKTRASADTIKMSPIWEW